MNDIIFMLPSMEGGGAERVVSVLSKYFAEHKYKVAIYLFNKNIVEYALDEKVLVDTSHIIEGNGWRKKFNRFFSMRRIIRKNPDAVFISFFSMYNLYLLAAGFGRNSRIIVSERLDPKKSLPNHKLIFAMRNLLYRRARRIVFQTQEAKEFFPKTVQEKGVVVPNPLKEGLPERHTGIRRKEVVTFARLEPQKNYPLLINAFELFLKTHNDYTLSIYGKGTMENHLKKIVRDKQLEPCIKFRGFSNALHREIRDAAMFVLPSDYEGLSNSMLEAMAIGLPCICTDCPPGGARMFIENGKNGILVPVGDVSAMVTAMQKIADSQAVAEKLSENAVTVREQLKVSTICQTWEEIIHACSGLR